MDAKRRAKEAHTEGNPEITSSPMNEPPMFNNDTRYNDVFQAQFHK